MRSQLEILAGGIERTTLPFAHLPLAHTKQRILTEVKVGSHRSQVDDRPPAQDPAYSASGTDVPHQASRDRW